MSLISDGASTLATKIKDAADVKCFVLSVFGEFVDIPIELCLAGVAP